MPITIKRTINIEIGDNNRIGNFIGGKNSTKEAKRKVQNYTVKMRTSVQKSKRG